MSRFLDFLDAPLGDASKVMAFLAGGRFDGDSASIAAPAPELIAVAPCDGSCARDPLAGGRRCGLPTHWHDVAEGDSLGDVPRHAAYYVLVRTQPAPSGMRAALYVSAGHERPARAEMTRARNDFERRIRRLADHHQRPERGIAA